MLPSAPIVELLHSTAAGLWPFFLAYLSAMLVEAVVVVHRRRRGTTSLRGYDAAESTVNVVSWLTAMVAWIPINVATWMLAWWLWPYRVTDLGFGVVGWLAAALAWDFSFYWQHRAEHVVRLLWAGHVTHHSSERFNYSTGFRQSWTPWTGPLFYAGWALLGVQPVLLFVAGGWNLVYQFFLHTELVPRMPWWVEGWLNTPSNHRVHHARNPAYQDRNFGGALVVWDRLFGTYVPETEPAVYGVTTPVRARDPIGIQVEEYADIARDAWRAGSWRQTLECLIRMESADQYDVREGGEIGVASDQRGTGA